MPLLWRLLLKNYFQVFFLCVLGFISVLLVTRVQEIARLAALNSEMGKIFLFTFFQIPYILPIAIPISGLISAILLLQRLSYTHELTAFRASGISMKTLSTPLLLTAVVLSMVTFVIVAEVTPRCRLLSHNLIQSASTINPLFLMKKSNMLKLRDSFVDMKMTHLGKEAKDVLFAVKNESNDRLSLMTAKKFAVEDNLMTGKQVAIISNAASNEGEFDSLIIENQEMMSTSASALSGLMRKTTKRIGMEHLPMTTLMKTFRDPEAKAKTVKKAQFEFCRRLFFPSITFAFTLLGFSLGMQIGRGKKKKGLCFAILLSAFTLLSSIAAKSFHLFPHKVILFYALPLSLSLFYLLLVSAADFRGGRMIWQRYILKEILKVFFLFLGTFFFLYALIDYSMHMQEILKNKKISWIDLSFYYGMLFSKRCNLLLPLSLLISSVKVLTSLNKRNELLSLQTAGIALHKITRPFFLIGLLCVGLSYLNFEVLAPKSLNFINHFEQKHLKKKSAAVHTLPLEDGSRLLYQLYDVEKQEFFDLFWVQTADSILHMKTLQKTTPYPVGTYVDVLKRNTNGQMEKVASYDKKIFDTLHLNFDLENHFETSMESRSITGLLKMTLQKTPLFIEQRPQVYTSLYFKLLMPFLPVIVLIGVIPFCVISSRTLSTFLVFSLTIFGYITFFTLMDGCIILGEMRVMPPFWAIFTLPIAFFFIFGPRFIRMCVR